MEVKHFNCFKFYTYLKLQGSQTVPFASVTSTVFYTYLKLQGSQTVKPKAELTIPFYTYLKLQGSQTICIVLSSSLAFYTYLKLQGSQTSNGHHRTYIPGGIVTSDIFILQLNTCLCL